MTPSSLRGATRSGRFAYWSSVALQGAGGLAVAVLAWVSPVTLAVVAGAAGSIVLHEAAHLWALRALGDRTAAAHGVRSAWDLLDWRWTAALPAASAALSALLAHVVPAFPVLLAGWAKQLPVDFNELRGDKRVSAGLASLAGPAMNVALALGLAGAAWLLPMPLAAAGGLMTLAKINAGLAAFNMLPLPHLDGGKALVALMPRSWYARWLYNDQVPADYQNIFQRLYEGPSALLNFLSMTSQRRVNLLAAGITFGLFVGASVAGWAFLQAPLVLMMLVCSYDYYCIREKVQNEQATRALQGIIQGFASKVAEMADQDSSIRSEIDPEEVEHSLKNAFENTMDAVVDSEGFEALGAAERWQRLEAAYLDAATAELKRAGMSADDPATIRRVLDSQAGREYRGQLKGWIERYDLFRKWHSPGRKAAKARKEEQSQEQAGEKTAAIGTATKAVVALAVAGGATLMALAGGPAGGMALASAGMAAVMAGTLAPQEPAPAPGLKTFAEALNDRKLKLDTEKIQKLSRLLKEMKLSDEPPVIGREDLINRTTSIVSAPRGDINSVIWLGEAGVGKTAIAEGLAQAMALSDTEPADGTFKLKRMDGRYLVELDASALMAEEDPLKTLMLLLDTLPRFNDADPKKGNKVVVFIDEVHKLFTGPKADQMAQALLIPLRKGELTVIAATTPARYKELIKKHDEYKRRFIAMNADPLNDEETLRALEGRQDHYEQRYDLTIEPEALEAAVRDTKVDHDRQQPDSAFHYLRAALREAGFDGRRERVAKAIKSRIEELQYNAGKLARRLAKTAEVKDDLKNDEPKSVTLYNKLIDLSQAIVGLYAERAKIPTSGKPVVGAEAVQEQIALEKSIPMSQFSITSKLAEKFLNFEKAVSKRVIGQLEAVRALGNALKRNAAGLSDPTKPIGVFYLNGPTGSGKTHLARETARYLFDDPDAMIRIDMSEYMEKHTVAQLKGAPPGYVGYDVGGQLTEQVDKHPYSVILFDEIEKAHPDVWMILLQILGSARLTDGQGKTHDFSKTLIMMTSNLGMQGINLDDYVAKFSALQEKKRRALAAEDKAGADALDEEMRALAVELSENSKKEADAATVAAFKGYPPEFRGRLSYAPVVMNRVTPEMALDIAQLNLEELRDDRLAKAGHKLTWTPDVVKVIVNEGYDVELGARPLQGAIDRLLGDRIADDILEAAMAGGGKVGPMRIDAAVEKGKIKLAVSPIPPEPVAKKDPGTGPAQELFGKVLSAALAAAANQVKVALTLKDVDGWLRGAASSAAPQPAEAAPAAVSEPSPVAPPAPQPAQPSPAPSVPAIDRAFTAEHYDFEAKDPQVRAAAAALKSALEVHGYPPSTVEALARFVPHVSDPYVGWLKIFAAQAKKTTPEELRASPVRISFDVSGEKARVAVRRPGPLETAERQWLTDHFSGTVPADSENAGKRAEQLEVMGRDGRRLPLDLYRKLSAIPGARMGWASNQDGVEYWIEIPKGTAKPAVAVTEDPLMKDDLVLVTFEDLSQEKMAEAVRILTPSHFEPLGPSTMRVSYRTAAEARAAAEGFARMRRVTAVTLGTRGRVSAEPPGEGQAQAGPSSQAEPVFASVDGSAARAKLKAGSGIASGWARVTVSGGISAATQTRALLLAHGLAVSEMQPGSGVLTAKARLNDIQAAVDSVLTLAQQPNVREIQLERALLERALAAPMPIARPDTSRRSRVADETTLAKIEAEPGAGPGEESEKTLWAEFAAAPAGETMSLHNYVKPVLAREGLTYVSHQLHDGMIRVRATAASAQDAGERAYRLAEDRMVTKVIVHPAARPYAARRPERAEPEEIAPVQPRRSAGPRGTALQLAAAILAQGDQRSAGVRTTAGDLFAAALTKDPQDLALARDWIRLEVINKAHYQIAAAAQALARLGERELDEPALLRALGFIEQSGDYTAHPYNPTKRRVAAALARLLDGADPRDILRRYREEQAKPSRGPNWLRPDQFERHHNGLLEEALTLALLRSDDPALEAAIMRAWQPSMAVELHDYLKRVDPDRLRAIYEGWRDRRPADPQPSGPERVLTPFAVADYGTKDDVVKLYDQLSSGWDNMVENNTAPLYARALGEGVARTGALPDLAEKVRRALKENLSNELNYKRIQPAIHVAGAAGDERYLPMLERLMRINPESGSQVNFIHEGTQHDAAEAWARIVHREGLTTEFLTQPRETAAGDAAPPLLQAWLIDTNPLINIAALEALRLLVERPVAPRPPGPRRPIRPIDAQFMLNEGPTGARGVWGATYLDLLDRTNEGTRFELRRMPEWKRGLADDWARRFGAYLTRLLGPRFIAQARVYNGAGDSEIVWVLRQAAGAIPGQEAVEAAADALATLILAAGKPEAEQAAALARLPVQPDEPRAFLELIKRLDGAGATMSIDARALVPSREASGSTEASDEGAAVPELRMRYAPPEEPGWRPSTPEEIARARNRAHGRREDGDLDAFGRPINQPFGP